MIDITSSIKDILITPLGSRVMRPEYGSLLYTLIDQKVDDSFKMKLTRYCAVSLEKFEPRVSLKGTKVLQNANGKLVIELVFENAQNLEVEILK